jgi:hypothetical protein
MAKAILAKTVQVQTNILLEFYGCQIGETPSQGALGSMGSNALLSERFPGNSIKGGKSAKRISARLH